MTDTIAAARPATPPPVRAARRDNLLASLVALLATIIGLILLAWTILYVTKGRFLKHTFERIASSSTERDVRVAGDFQLYFDPITIKFLAEGLTITNPKWAPRPYFFSSKLIDTRIATFPLIFGKRRADWLQLVDGDIDAEWDAAGKRNTWTFGKSTGKPFQLPVIRRALIGGTKVRYVDSRMQLLADIKVDTIHAADTRFAEDVRFSGNGRMRGKPFTMSGSLKSPNETVTGGRNQLVLNARSAGTVLDVSGTLPGATEIEGAPLSLRIRGPNMAEAFEFIGVAVPDSRSWRMTSALVKVGPEWRFTGMKGVVGSSDLSGRMTVAMIQPRLHIDADLQSRVVDIVDAGAWVGYDPDALAANGNQGAVRQVGGTPRMLPDAPLNVEALRAFDADVRYKITTVRAKSFPVSNIGMTLKLDDRILSLTPLTFDLSLGHVTSEIEINSRRLPVKTTYDIRLSPTPMGRLLAGFGVEESGTTGTIKARIQMTGEGDTVYKSLSTSDGRIAIILPQGSLWARNIQLSELDIGTFVQKMFEDKLKDPVQINCGLIAFTVRDGIAAADPILIDTRKNVILGRGGFSFKNERLDMAVRADSKKISLFAGQSPVGIGGYFAAPSIDPISKQLIARAGTGLGLAVVGTPLAAVLAFVDVGDAKSTQCGPVLSGANATQQRDTKGRPRDDVGKGTTAKSEDGKRSNASGEKQKKKFLGIF